MNVYTLTAPSAWASYLINGDASGIDAEDIAQCEAWLAREGLGLPVDCEDAGFRWHHDADVECPLGADCQEYTFLVPDDVGVEPEDYWLPVEDDAASIMRELGA